MARRSLHLMIILVVPSNCTSFYSSGARRFCNGTGKEEEEFFSGENAYEILGLPQNCNFAEIKASFRRLAKQTHPDLQSELHSESTRLFLRIIAAYEILSHPERRARYDLYLLSRQPIVRRKFEKGSISYSYDNYVKYAGRDEVPEWIEHYRLVIHDILSEEIMVGSGYLEQLEGEFYAAIRKAYFGPVIDSMEYLPDCFEAEMRSSEDTSEILHLVSGRFLFGNIQIIDKVPKLSSYPTEKVPPFAASTSDYKPVKDVRMCDQISSQQGIINLPSWTEEDTQGPLININTKDCDAYKDLELKIAGMVVATATRDRALDSSDAALAGNDMDCIKVFLSPEIRSTQTSQSASISEFPESSKGLLGTITGLGTSGPEGSCSVYDGNGIKTHMIMKHRTLMVKHMHWYQVGDNISACECRCSQAKQLPSKLWLFEPRCNLHDIGGWYVETFGRDKKGKTVPCKRHWHNLGSGYHEERSERRLHPAMYLIALAYRTLDLEEAKKKHFVRERLVPKISSIVNWCKRFV